jgi:ribosomal protein L11 methyltransferase
MINSQHTCNQLQKNIPYKDLYIYYLQGEATDPFLPKATGYIGNWQEDGFSFLFFSEPAESTIELLLKSRPELFLVDHYRMSYEEWQGQQLTAMRIGSLLIVPPWEKNIDSTEPQKTIFLDPGVVFGNGAHVTTRGCLQALEFVLRRDPLESAVDLGTGTGILAMAAVRLGCRRCLAVDFNYLAAKTALENVGLNRMDSQILVVNARAEYFLTVEAELIIANMHYDVMKRMVESKDFYSKKWYILSGLLRSEAKDIEDRIRRSGIELIKTWDHDGIWHTFLGKIR